VWERSNAIKASQKSGSRASVLCGGTVDNGHKAGGLLNPSRPAFCHDRKVNDLKTPDLPHVLVDVAKNDREFVQELGRGGEGLCAIATKVDFTDAACGHNGLARIGQRDRGARDDFGTKGRSGGIRRPGGRRGKSGKGRSDEKQGFHGDGEVG